MRCEIPVRLKLTLILPLILSFVGIFPHPGISQIQRLNQTQRRVARPEVQTISMNDVTLAPGGNEAIIILDGKHMDRVKNAQLFSGRIDSRYQRRIPGREVEVTVVKATSNQLTLSLKAKPGARIAQNYFLQLQDDRQNKVAEISNLTKPNQPYLKIAVTGGTTPGKIVKSAQGGQRPVARQPGSVTSKIASNELSGPMRWSTVSMLKRSGDGIKPTYLGGSRNIKVTPKPASIKNDLIEINKRSAIAFKPIDILDPGESSPTPIDPNTTFNLPNGVAVKAGDYYGELNRLEKEFNKSGYSLDYRKQKEENYHYARITKTTTGFGTLANPRLLKERASKRWEMMDRSIQNTIAGSKSSLSRMKSNTQIMGKQTTSEPSLQRSAPTNRARQRKATQPAKVAQPNPFDRSVPAEYFEYGDKDFFAAFVKGESKLSADTEKMKVIHSASLGGYVFNQKFDFNKVVLATSSSYSGGELQYLFSGILGLKPIFPVHEKKAVPAIPPNQMSPLPEIASGGQTYNGPDLDYAFALELPVGPSVLSLRVGVVAATGFYYSCYASPVYIASAFTPWVSCDAYAQAGISCVIMDFNVRSKFTIIEGNSSMVGWIQRNTERIFIHQEVWRSCVLCSGSIQLIAGYYVPAFGLPPWKKKEYKTTLVSYPGEMISKCRDNFSKTHNLIR